MKRKERGYIPSFALPPIKEVVPDDRVKAMIAEGRIHPETKQYTMGDAKIMVCPPYGKIGWFMEILGARHYPSTEEVLNARFILLPHGSDFMVRLPTALQYFDDLYQFTLYEAKSIE